VSIHAALVELLGKPIAESNALCIATGMYPFPGGPTGAYRFITGKAVSPLTGLGWKSLGVLELTALPSVKPVPTYGIDDQTAIKVIDSTVAVVSEGHWKLFNPVPPSADTAS